MSYLKELQDHYKAVRARLRQGQKPPRALLPPPMPQPLPEPPKAVEAAQSSQPEPGLFPSSVERSLVTDALREANPEWIGSNHMQAVRIAEEMADAPRLPPLPGLVLNEVGAVRWLRVLHAVADYHDVTALEILSSSRKRHIIQARFEVFYRLRVDLNFSYLKIAGLMKKDHTTVLHGVRRMKAMLFDAANEARDYRASAGENRPVERTSTSSLPG